MERLMDGLASVLAQVPEDPMVPEWIGIQSRGMKQWIATQVARKLGICANISFLFPRQMIELFLSGPQPCESGMLTPDALMWSVMEGILENSDTPCFASLKKYIGTEDSGRRLFQLSMKIARVFDDYQIYRPNLLLDWENKAQTDRFKDPVMAWQSVLWKKIAHSRPKLHVAARMEAFLKKGIPGGPGADPGAPTGIPQRISLFGVSAMPPRFLEFFGALARTMDVYLFLLTPSNQFFFDMRSRRQMEKMALDNAGSLDMETACYEVANPLLASLGQSGSVFHESLENFDYHEPLGDLFEDPLDQSSSMLSFLQSDILNLIVRKAGTETLPVAVDPKDTSVSIHACHSPMREAQVVKDLLLDAFENDPDLCPHEVIVMMPDIEAYAPYLTAVFASEHPLPFSVSDRKKKSESETLTAFLKILALKESRLEPARVLDLLLSPAIAVKFDILAEELMVIEEKVQEAKILWGRDKAHRKELTGAAFDENTWMFGFRRLFMGYGLPQDHETLVADILPCDAFEGLEAGTLGKIAHFAHTLFDRLSDLAPAKTIQMWGESLRTLVLSMMEKTHDNEADMVFLLHTIDAFVRDGEMAGYSRKIDFFVVRDIIEGKLDKTIAQGSFLAGSLTFCNLMPMRSIPFKVVVLMGMDEAGFPRKPMVTGFDLIKKYPRKGDKQEPEEDRNLFLESLLSARDRLIITHTGMSIKDNSPIPCSCVVEELKDAMKAGFKFPEGFDFCFWHPLHPFNPVYFNKTASFFSFSQDQCRIAVSQAEPGKNAFSRQAFLPREFCLIPQSQPDPVNKSVTLTELVRFFRNPVAEFVTQGLNLCFPEIKDPVSDREEFQLSGLSGYALGSLYMDKAPENDLYDRVRAGGLLPFGQKGRSEWDRISSVADPILALAGTFDPGAPLPPLGVDTRVGEMVITGTLTDCFESGRFTAGFGRLTPARLLTQWIYHLFLNARGCKFLHTRMVGRDPKGKLPAVVYSFGPLSSAPGHIEALVSLYEEGRRKVLPFFCDTSFSLAQSLSTKNFEKSRENIEFALVQARRFWFDPFYGKGEGINRYVELIFGHKDPFETLENLMESQIIETALLVYQPLLENLTCES